VETGEVVEEEEEEGEVKPALLVWLGEGLVWRPLALTTADIWEEEQMMELISIPSQAPLVTDGDPVAAAPLVPVAGLHCDARDRQCLFGLLPSSGRAE